MSEISSFSPELKDIIERPQNRLSCFIFCFMFAFVALLVLLGVLIESPDIVVAEAKVSSSNPPIVLRSKSIGRIHFIVDSLPSTADSAQYLAIVENAADYSNVLELKNLLRQGPSHILNNESIDSTLQLGELSSFYFSLKNSVIRNSQLKDSNDDYHRRIALYSQRIDYEKEELALVKASFLNSVRQFEIKKKRHEEDSVLYLKKAITESQFSESCLNLLNSQKYLITGEDEILAKKKSIDENRLQIEILSKEYYETLESSENDLETKYKELLAQIRTWEDRYVICSPSHCLVERASVVSDGDYVEIGEPIFNCLFPNNDAHAVAMLPGQMSGKVKVGQMVNIKLESYPYTEYGTIIGFVEGISMNTVERGYLLYIALPNGLLSTNGKNLSFAETVYGQAEIITEKRRLITRLYHQLYYLFSTKRIIDNKDNNNNRTNKF